jgi:2-aminoethylphosphonate-pyruvate transaminase
LGWQAAAVLKFVREQDLAHRFGLRLSFYENPQWEGPNGLSVLAARTFLARPTLLVMADQIAAPALVRQLVNRPAGHDPTLTWLAIDRDRARVFDLADATKVQLTGERITGISKTLSSYDAVSTGLFLATPRLLDALDALDAPSSSPSLTEGVAEAARRGWVAAHDAGTLLWQDVDSPAMKQHAEWLLRAYGDNLAQPEVQAPPPSPAADTLALVERLLAEKDQAGYVLLNPGPVMTSARVKAALVHHDTCHRDADYEGVVRRLQEKLRPVFGASPAHEMLLLTGSGTAAMEMALASLVPPDRKLLVVANGAFGERLTEIAELHGLALVNLRYAWGQIPDPADVERALAADPAISTVALIHHETSVGVLNPVREIGAICHARKVTLLVDSVSALGAEELDVVRDHVDLCYASANKCLHSVSGVSFLCVAPSVWPRVASIKPRAYYLDLLRYRRYLTELAQTPFTPAVSAFFALEAALDEFEEGGGLRARRETYRKRNLRIRRVLTDLGFSSFTNTGRESVTISTLRLPDDLKVEQLYDGCKKRGFVIYRCKGILAARHIQIANMGELTDGHIDAFLAALTAVVEDARRKPATTAIPVGLS